MRLDGKSTPKGDLDYEIECVVNALDGIGAPPGNTLADRIWALKPPAKAEEGPSTRQSLGITAILRNILTAPWSNPRWEDDGFYINLPQGRLGIDLDVEVDLLRISGEDKITLYVGPGDLTSEQRAVVVQIRDRLVTLAQDLGLLPTVGALYARAETWLGKGASGPAGGSR